MTIKTNTITAKSEVDNLKILCVPNLYVFQTLVTFLIAHIRGRAFYVGITAAYLMAWRLGTRDYYYYYYY
jgi:hypothetical protein